MAIEAEPKTHKPTPEELRQMDEKDLEQRIEDLGKQMEALKKEIEENERVIQEGIENDPTLKKELDDLEEQRRQELEKINEKERHWKEERESKIDKIRQYIAKIRTEHFNVKHVPKRFLYNPDFMRYVPGDKFMALMESKGLDDHEKELVLRARFKFCFDWLKSSEYKKYQEEKAKYDEAFKRWLDDPQSKTDKKGNPIDKDGAPLPKEPNFPALDEIREKFRNDIRNIKELVLIDHYMPEIFDHFDFVGHIRFPHIQEIRKHEAFAGRGRKIRKVKVKDFYDIIENLQRHGIGKGDSKKYLQKFSVDHLRALRKRMGRKGGPIDGKEKSEISSIGSQAWGSPITMDLFSQSILQGYKADTSDKRTIAKHMLIAFAMEEARGEKGVMSSKNKSALQWFRGTRQGRDFYLIDEEFIQAVEDEEKIKIPREKLNRLYPFKETEDGEFNDDEDYDDEDEE